MIALFGAPQTAVAETDADAQSEAPDVFAGAALGGDELDAIRAAQETDTVINAAVSEQVVIAENSGNHITADTVTNGAITIDAGALQGFTGLGNFVINTGNNNNLQGNLSVSIVMPTNGQ